MQTAKGNKPQALVASEMGALMCLRVLPKEGDVRAEQHGGYMSPAYIEIRKQFAAEINRPGDWHLIAYPFYLSLDNDKRHPSVRKLLAKPRLSKSESVQVEAAIDKWRHDWLQQTVEPAWQRVFQQGGEQSMDEQGIHGEQREQLVQQLRAAYIQKAHADFQQYYGCTVRQWAFAELAVGPCADAPGALWFGQWHCSQCHGQ